MRYFTVADIGVLHTLAQRRANFTDQRQVFGQRLIGALEHRNTFLALEQFAEQITRERAIHGHVDHTDLELAFVAQVIGDGLGLHDHAALAEYDVISILCAVCRYPMVAPAGQLVELIHGLFGESPDMVKEIRALRYHRLHVGVLVLHRAGQNRVVDIPQLGNAPAAVTVEHSLRRCRAFDDIFRVSEVLGDQLALGYIQWLDQVGGQEAVLGDGCRRQ